MRIFSMEELHTISLQYSLMYSRAGVDPDTKVHLMDAFMSIINIKQTPEDFQPRVLLHCYYTFTVSECYSVQKVNVHRSEIFQG